MYISTFASKGSIEDRAKPSSNIPIVAFGQAEASPIVLVNVISGSDPLKCKIESGKVVPIPILLFLSHILPC